MLEDKKLKEEEESAKKDFFRKIKEKEQEQGYKNLNRTRKQEQSTKSFYRIEEQEEEHDQIPGSTDTFTPQEPGAIPVSKEQRSQSSQEQELIEEG